ncbi:MAG: hypothetical protein JSS55_02295 [Proteobacteria bacterium]|nr:hypothetical protein [Pseudomonadota bacterium]
MALYFFNLGDGDQIADEEGQEFATLAEARLEAVRSARSIMREEILQGTLSLRESIHILDANGDRLETVYFRDAVKIEE